jgi:hypothetical protein
MCCKCKMPETLIGLYPENLAAQGCPVFWQTWCAQNAEQVEREVTDWLNRNSHCLRIMGLQALLPNMPGTMRSRIAKQLVKPYKMKKKAEPENG